jgi:hypothetical protein
MIFYPAKALEIGEHRNIAILNLSALDQTD